MKIAVVGTGYVGLVVGACLAENGNDVICVDKDAVEDRHARAGQDADLRARPRRDGPAQPRRRAPDRSRPTCRRRCRRREIVFIAVGTPQGEDGSADLQHVLGVARDVGRAIEQVHRRSSTRARCRSAPPRRCSAAIAGETTQPFSVVSNPEFLKQGAAIEDFMKPDRVVIGSDDERSADVMQELYAPFTRTGAPIMMMDTASAELCKYAANSILATRISFMNEIANVCELVGADVDQVRQAIGSDRRIGTSFLFPGVGYGGSCFPKDVKALLKSSTRQGLRLQDPRRGRGGQRRAEARGSSSKMEAHFGDLQGRTIALWGLAFKPRTDDMREAPAITIIEPAARARRHRCAPTIRKRPTRRAGMFGDRDHALREELRRAERRRRAGHRHRVERVPRARLQADASSC